VKNHCKILIKGGYFFQVLVLQIS